MPKGFVGREPTFSTPGTPGLGYAIECRQSTLDDDQKSLLTTAREKKAGVAGLGPSRARTDGQILGSVC
jgi:hypothetical protein